MKLKSLIMTAAVALTLSACAHKATETCACGKDKTACSETKECPMHKGEGCEHCKGEEKTPGK
ncbi:hypothetical protein [Bdellovibrio sp. NC01]|uniref:hypothetical protein n=1 Tax=Bdellovibrio sp. NC01 TaxID=2220073 RepID=UPI00115811CD|nr:hypothetical protein [Bdellovibrio sp. NC01]QDK37624.1 hypothetical protein DOE51_08530 [Bdellovibrio sp. NC01]